MRQFFSTSILLAALVLLQVHLLRLLVVRLQFILGGLLCLQITIFIMSLGDIVLLALRPCDVGAQQPVPPDSLDAVPVSGPADRLSWSLIILFLVEVPTALLQELEPVRHEAGTEDVSVGLDLPPEGVLFVLDSNGRVVQGILLS